MRIDERTKIWLVLDPAPLSAFDDIFVETNLTNFQYQAIGNHGPLNGVTLYLDRNIAMADARARYEAVLSYRKILRKAKEKVK